jgi:hypothetical protein
LLAATFAALVLSKESLAQMQVGDIMTPGGMPAAQESLQCMKEEQRQCNDYNNAGQPQYELTTSQGGKLPDPIGNGTGSGGGGSSGSGLESPIRAARAYTKYPTGCYDMGSNHNAAAGLADGVQSFGALQTVRSGGGGSGGADIATAFAGRSSIYGGYAGEHFAAGANYSAGTTGANFSAGAGNAAVSAGVNSSGISISAGSGIGNASIAVAAPPAVSTAINGVNSILQNGLQVVTAPETEPLLGPPQVFGGLSAPMAANMIDMLRESGLAGPQGGKMLGAASAGMVGIKGMFQQQKAANMPGADTEQTKVNQNAEKGQSADNLAGMEREQAATAIDFVRTYLENFTANPGNKWNRLRDTLFVPMALLLLLPGAVLAQVKSIIAQGVPVLGEVNPWEGILRAIVAIFLIPATYLVMNYGIDVANSFTKTIADQYKTAFKKDMYEEAFSGHVRAFPIRTPDENYDVIPNIEASMYNLFGNSPLARLEGKLLATKYEDPAAGLYVVPVDRANETVPFLVNEARLMYNKINAGLAFAWTILCAVQQCYLYYLWFVGPIVAALWVYPMGQLRQALPNWIEGVVSLCFWSFFWNTTILLMACFRGVDDTGTIVFTALNMLALGSVKFAFDFSGLVKDAGKEAAGLVNKAAMLAAESGKKEGGTAPGTTPEGSTGTPAPTDDPCADSSCDAAPPIDTGAWNDDNSSSDDSTTNSPACEPGLINDEEIDAIDKDLFPPPPLNSDPIVSPAVDCGSLPPSSSTDRLTDLGFDAAMDAQYYTSDSNSIAGAVGNEDYGADISAELTDDSNAMAPTTCPAAADVTSYEPCVAEAPPASCTDGPADLPDSVQAETVFASSSNAECSVSATTAGFSEPTVASTQPEDAFPLLQPASTTDAALQTPPPASTTDAGFPPPQPAVLTDALPPGQPALSLAAAMDQELKLAQSGSFGLLTEPGLPNNNNDAPASSLSEPDSTNIPASVQYPQSLAGAEPAAPPSFSGPPPTSGCYQDQGIATQSLPPGSKTDVLPQSNEPALASGQPSETKEFWNSIYFPEQSSSANNIVAGSDPDLSTKSLRDILPPNSVITFNPATTQSYLDLG